MAYAYANDPRQIRIALIGLLIMAVVSSALIILWLTSGAPLAGRWRPPPLGAHASW